MNKTYHYSIYTVEVAVRPLGKRKPRWVPMAIYTKRADAIDSERSWRKDYGKLQLFRVVRWVRAQPPRQLPALRFANTTWRRKPK